MDLNPIKKLKASNSPPPPRGPPRTIDEFNSGKKLISKLNHDCLAKVLMYVPVPERLEMEKVCQKWKEAVELSWYNVKRLDCGNLMIRLDKRREILEMIMRKCARYLRHLTITGIQYPWLSSVLNKKNCQNITHFIIDMTEKNKYRITNKNLVKILSLMNKLKYLKVTMDQLRGSVYHNRVYASILFNEILEKLPPGDNIEEIHLIIIPSAELTFQQYQNAPALNKFNSLHCLTLQGFTLTNDDTLNGILQSKNTLSKLDLSRCEFSTSGLSIFKNLKNLEELILWKIVDLNVDEIISIAHNCLKLKHFEFDGIDIFGKSKKIPYCIFSELKYLNLNYLRFGKIDKSNNTSGNIIFGIANNWKQLKYLDIDRGSDFSLLDFQEITRFKNLQYLYISRASHIDSQSFLNIVNKCLELKELLLSFVGKIAKRDFEKLKNLKKIEKLNFAFCDNLSGNLLSKIINNCKNLVNLELWSCNNLTENSLIQVGKLKHLKRLEINRIKNIPNSMFNDFRELEYLSCHDCPTVTDEDIIKVLDNCLNLYYLEMRGPGITVKSLVHASKRKFVFKILDIWVDLSVEKKYKENNSMSLPYLRINK